MAQEHVMHSIAPTFDRHSRVLVLGSIPSPKSREGGYNYGHPQNRFWRVLAHIADEPVPATNERKRDFCLRHHIALWDVLAECDIEGANDASIRNARANDLTIITAAAPIEAVYCTGAKAHELYGALGLEQACGLPAAKLPSTSPANATCSFDDLVRAYAPIFDHVHEETALTFDVEEVVRLERVIDASGTTLAELMDRAGSFAAHRVLKQLGARGGGEGACAGESVVVLCGSGNNGGDGWVAAELLAGRGLAVTLVTAGPAARIKAQPARDAAIRAMRTLAPGARAEVKRGSGRAECRVLVDPDADELERAMAEATIVVDAILGTGFSGTAVKEPYASWIDAANRARGQRGTFVISADVASGVNAQTGAVSRPCIRADETVAMIVLKPGLTAAECGKVVVAPLVYLEPFLGRA